MHSNRSARVSRIRWMCLVGVVLGTAGSVFATGMPVTASIIEVTATSGEYTATFEEVFPVSSFTGDLLWSLPAPVALSSRSVELGTIDLLKVGFNADPDVALEFSLTNTNLNNPILYNIRTATIYFDGVADAVAEALASITLTQGSGSPPSRSITGQFAGGKCYQARYSTSGMTNTGTVFANLDSSMSFPGGLSSDESEYAGPTSLGATVWMMEAEYRFILSAGDQASGTSIFVITPEPTTLALLGLGAVLGLRRRRLPAVLMGAARMSRTCMWAIAACGLTAAIFTGSSAFAAGMPVTANIIEVTATSGDLSATFEEVFPVGSFDGNLLWSLPAPVSLAAGATSLGTISRLNVTFNADPEIDLNFSLTNTNPSLPVTFDILTATIVFDAIPNAEAAASASMTLTQGAGSPAGASVTGKFTGGKCYQARYSTDSLLNTATVFASLDPSMSFTSGLGRSETETLPADGMAALGTTVYMMESEYKFTLSAGDQASGSSIFLITPEPATLMLAALGAFTVVRKRGSCRH